jgi:hypothetical protein
VEGFYQLKNPVALSGVEPATFHTSHRSSAKYQDSAKRSISVRGTIPPEVYWPFHRNWSECLRQGQRTLSGPHVESSEAMPV